VIVQGDADFRPTGMAVAPDGSLYFADWVLRDYPVHGKGRIWRLVLPDDEVNAAFPARLQADLNPSNDSSGAVVAAASNDPFVRTQVVSLMSRRPAGDPVIGITDGLQLALLQAERIRATIDATSVLREALRHESPDIRLYAVRWIADERIMALRDDVAKLLQGPQADSRYYLAVLAALDWLDHEPKMRGRDIADELLVRELKNDKRSPTAHALALQLLSPNHKFLTLDRLHNYLQADYPPLRLETVRTLAQHSDNGRIELMAATARDNSQSVEVRAEAIAGLAPAAESYKDLLEEFAAGKNHTLRKEAERVMRLSKQRSAEAEAKPAASDLAAWRELLKEPGDAAAGRRMFFSSVGARCAVCHQYDGRGGRIGPDLTHIGRNAGRERIVASILQPSREVAPHYQPWILTTKDGKTLVGLKVPEAGDDGIEEFTDIAGARFTIPSAQIERRETAKTSIMPDGLENMISIADLRDLVTFLATDTAQ
jgi:putative heme-binding domain-containing protein